MRRFITLVVTVLVALGLVACGGESEQTGSTEPAEAETATTAEEAPRVEGAELAAMLAHAGVVLLDVREPSELEELGTVVGYVNIPIGELEGRLDELPRDKPILTA